MSLPFVLIALACLAFCIASYVSIRALQAVLTIAANVANGWHLLAADQLKAAEKARESFAAITDMAAQVSHGWNALEAHGSAITSAWKCMAEEETRLLQAHRDHLSAVSDSYEDLAKNWNDLADRNEATAQIVRHAATMHGPSGPVR